MTLAKRLMDISLSFLLGLMLVLPFLVIAIAVLVLDGRPVFHRAERMRSPTCAFTLWKFRTMRPCPGPDDPATCQTARRITPLGRVLRQSRLDEIPQLWNILRGDMSLVGPRPPLRSYVERFPVLYAQILQNRPGLTGLATLVYHRHEDQLLSRSGSHERARQIYFDRCIPQKAKIDAIWAQNRTLLFDLRILIDTILGRIGAPIQLRPTVRRLRRWLRSSPPATTILLRPSTMLFAAGSRLQKPF